MEKITKTGQTSEKFPKLKTKISGYKIRADLNIFYTDKNILRDKSKTGSRLH